MKNRSQTILKLHPQSNYFLLITPHLQRHTLLFPFPRRTANILLFLRILSCRLILIPVFPVIEESTFPLLNVQTISEGIPFLFCEMATGSRWRGEFFCVTTLRTDKRIVELGATFVFCSFEW